MGQRFVELETSYTAFSSNSSATLHISQLPPNPAILAPGPALLFIVVNGIPSIGVQIMVGSGQIGDQQRLPVGSLPATEIRVGDQNSATNKNNGVRRSWDASLLGAAVGALLGTWVGAS